MARLSMNEVTTYRWSFEEDVQHYVAAGLDGIGVWRQKLSDYGEEKGIELLQESGLPVSCVLWAGGFTGSDGRTYRDSVEDAEEAIRLAAALAADSLIVYSGGRAGHTHSHARRLMRSALSSLSPLADRLGVTLAIEPMHVGCAREWTFLTDLEDTLALLDDIGSPRLKLVFDTYHMAHDLQTLERLPQLVDRLAVVQLGDARQLPDGDQNRCRLGDGKLQLRRVVDSLQQAGYQGFFDVELVGEELESTDYDELVAHSQAAFAELVAS